MSKFEFRLQTVLEYRELVEGWAKDHYLECRAARLEAEGDAQGIEKRRQEVLTSPIQTLAEHRALELLMVKLDDDQHNQQAVILLLLDDEEKAMEAWHEKRQELEVLVKLRDKALAEWELEQNRKEQAELDEWSVLRRTA